MIATGDPFGMMRRVLAAQQAQIDLAQALVRSARSSAAWQKAALDATITLMNAQRQWLALWGLAPWGWK